MTKCIAFHSYKGGTGKTTIACNFAAYLCSAGYRVFMLDLDVYAPSMQTYFTKEPVLWINDFLSSDDVNIEDIMVDMTDTLPGRNKEIIGKNIQEIKNSKSGKLYVCFSNSSKEEVYRLDGSIKEVDKIRILRKFIRLRETLTSDYNADYIIIDTSPGIRYWSLNALALADILFLTLKVDDLDIGGTKKMAGDVYSSFTKFGAKSYLLLNRVAGYCVPRQFAETSPELLPLNKTMFSTRNDKEYHDRISDNSNDISNTTRTISNEIGMDVIAEIPCYCDIQFSKREFLTVLRYPDHPFARQIEQLTKAKQIKL